MNFSIKKSQCVPNLKINGLQYMPTCPTIKTVCFDIRPFLLSCGGSSVACYTSFTHIFVNLWTEKETVPVPFTEAVQHWHSHSVSSVCESMVLGTEPSFTFSCWHRKPGDSGVSTFFSEVMSKLSVPQSMHITRFQRYPSYQGFIAE